jgi:hypothetical protein
MAYTLSMDRIRLDQTLYVYSEGHLQPDLDGPDHKRLWDIRAVRLLFDGLLANGGLVYPQVPDWFHIATAAQRLQVRPDEVLGLANGKEPDWLGKLAGKDGHEAFSKSYGLKPKVAMILVRGVHVPSMLGGNPKNEQHQNLADARVNHNILAEVRTASHAGEAGRPSRLIWRPPMPRLFFSKRLRHRFCLRMVGA